MLVNHPAESIDEDDYTVTPIPGGQGSGVSREKA
jgi:hypothetical protein